jgi:hypothetical protein
MLSCREVTELSTRLLEGGLPFWPRMQLRMHLSMCRHCRAFVDQLRKTVQVVARVPRRPISEASRATALRRFREQTPRPR